MASAAALAITVPAFAGSIGHEDRMEMAAVAQAPVTPNHAIRIAETGGGTAYGYGMEATHGAQWYEVDVLRGGAKLEVRIDPATGKVLGSSAAKGEDAEGANALDRGKLSFSEAVAKAEKAGHGRALEASAAGHGANAHVDVDVIQGKSIAHYRVSIQNGQIRTRVTGTSS
ncbi:MAG TPA: PepSY domain-containing protein [Rhodanobacteraceae bacterium]|nr:PepSY domain-containing protein [Rhodanobacteraceae bacterium]